jgi:hypothetical protein
VEIFAAFTLWPLPGSSHFSRAMYEEDPGDEVVNITNFPAKNSVVTVKSRMKLTSQVSCSCAVVINGDKIFQKYAKFR